MRAVVLALLFLTACGAHYRPLNPAERSQAHQTHKDWNAWLLPDAASCDPGDLRIRYERDPDRFLDLTQFCAPDLCPSEDCPNGCAHGAFSWDDDPQRITIWEPAEDRDRTLRHEFLHWLGHCTGIGGDPGHLDRRWLLVDWTPG